MNKIIAIFFLVFFSSLSWAQETKQLKNFDELMKFLESGSEVNLVLHYNKCKLISDNEEVTDAPNAIGGMRMDVWEYFAPMAVYNKKAFVVASSSKLIQYPKGDGYVFNYVKIKVYDDNSVKITAEYLDAISYKVLMSENFFGKVNDGKNNEGIYMYVN